jgi:hypothetical protein
MKKRTISSWLRRSGNIISCYPGRPNAGLEASARRTAAKIIAFHSDARQEALDA